MNLPLLQRLKRHPFPVTAFFRHSLVLTYALPQDVLRPLLPPGLTLDTFGNFGFVAIAMVQIEKLRPAFLPEFLGQNFFLCGYRIFARFQTRSGRTLRGLRILRSDTDQALMVFAGNLLTHYRYRSARVAFEADDRRLEVRISMSRAEADLHVIAHLGQTTTELSAASPFADWHQARLFAGPLPFTFDCEPETNSIILIEGVRQNWQPRPIRVEVLTNTFFDGTDFANARPVLASAFHVSAIPYRWKRGVVEALREAA